MGYFAGSLARPHCAWAELRLGTQQLPEVTSWGVERRGSSPVGSQNDLSELSIKPPFYA